MSEDSRARLVGPVRSSPGVRLNLDGRAGGASPGPRNPTAGAARPGCVGCGLAGLLGLVVLGMLAGMFTDDGEPTIPEPYGLNTLYSADTAASAGEAGTGEDFWVHSEMNVRSGPGEEHPVLRTAERGERVRLGPKDADGWAPVLPPDGTGGPAGYLYRASDQVRTYPPPAADSTPQRAGSGTSASGGRSGAAGRGYHLGPRGGCYTYSAGGRKRYVDRSFCD
ncbi:MAG TPA: SH3 domain-containing protein [Longimicrobiaceae bacterium]|jgi:hypothetical protein